MLQLAIYAWIWNITPRSSAQKEKDFRLFNIKTGELLRLGGSVSDLNEIITLLLCSRFSEPIVKTDGEFITDCLNYIQEQKPEIKIAD